ncbi:hypothetical protein PPYR_04825 [Photinus pyralis]|uniref:RHD domain-containing protein n=2 Tax=Photinus pyralis TaxID=7054 RepID=A0A5N4AZ70_PHOPY|nr:nuclear factor NF-kappa-B p105 subunit isoform X1 [Photinus pyralis]KAB0802639.1 hypothetical protein PPYR_04825 [Photinus pyralis]
MFELGILSNSIHLPANFEKTDLDMNLYPNLLTPPMDSPTSSMMSPDSDCRSPTHLFTPYQVPHIYSYNPDVVTIRDLPEPCLRMREPPVDKFRFRYKSEMSGTHGSLNGKTSDRSRKQTFPSVELLNYDKEAVIRCSLYQYGREDMAHTRQLHAHRLVKKQGTDEIDDPHNVHVNSDVGFVANFHSMGIIHTARKYIVPELIRKMTILKQEEIARSEHKFRPLTKKEELEMKTIAEKESKCINLNVVCLRFDAYRVVNNIYYPICQPVSSPAINNLKSALTGDLRIVRMDHCTSPCRGGREIFILVEKVTKKNIKVRFFELDDEDNEVWEDYGRFSDLDVHHQYAIVFKTPPYKHADIDKEVRVFIELQRPSDGARSEPKDFSYIPSEMSIGRKRTRLSSDDYTTSFFSADELPITLNTISPSVDHETMTNANNATINSADLEAALKHNNIDSSEFDKICNSLIGPGPMRDIFTAENVSIRELKSLGLVMDTPNSKIRTPLHSGKTEKLSVTEEENPIDRVKSELISFMKTSPSNNRVSLMLEALISGDKYTTSNGNNVLHFLAAEIGTEDEFVTQLLSFVKNFGKKELLNVKNINGQSPLHLAVEFGNELYLKGLIEAQADIAVQDKQGNTPLHVAIVDRVPEGILLTVLDAYHRSNTNIDIYNYDGKTPLHLAVRGKNLNATKLFINCGANVNAAEKKNGYTPLHLAILNRNIDILKYLLDSTKAECDCEDFAQYNPLLLAQELLDSCDKQTFQIFSILESHLKKIGIPSEMLLHNRVHSESDENDDEEDCSNNNNSADDEANIDIIDKYGAVTDFTDACKISLSDILDKSDAWKRLGESLDFGHILHTDAFAAVQHPTKSLLTFAVANGRSVKEIRDCLATLNEKQAVEIIDKMVMKC